MLMKIRASQVVAASVVAILVSIPLCGLAAGATWNDRAGTAMGLVGMVLFWGGAILLFTASQYSSSQSTPKKTGTTG